MEAKLKEDIIHRVDAIIFDKLNLEKDELFPEATLEEIGADSLDLVEIQMDVEQEFEISLDDDEVDIKKVFNVQGLYDLVIKEMNKKS